ncbi:hypothetical protein LQZ18_13025 [Lachnospiraceae bacterium ZAX-1]
MSELWLCWEKKAAVPFYCAQVGIHIHTIEELSYYLYQNIYLLDEDLLNMALYQWIGKELSKQALSVALQKGAQEGRSSLWCAMMIIQEGGCRTQEELEDLKKLYQEIGSKSRLECRKLRADSFLEHKKYVSCIMEYHRILHDEELKDATPILVGNLWHNLGVAHARLFLFEDAAQYFKKAYDLNQDKESLKDYLFAVSCAEKKRPAFIGQEQLTEVENEIMELLADARSEAFVNMASKIAEELKNGDRTGYYHIIKGFLDELRKDYKKRVTVHGII